jgi:hypothetical protein
MEVRHMPSPRWLAVPIAVGAALIAGAPVAAADPVNDAYLAQLRAIGLTWPPQTEPALIDEAHQICYYLTWGKSPQQIADHIHASLDDKGVTLLDVGTMVNAAHSTYCPGDVCERAALWCW